MEKIKVVFFDLGKTLVTESRRLIPGVPAMLGELHRRDVRLGIISNTGHLTRQQIIGTLPANFDFSIFEEQLIIFSSEAGFEKPDPQIFRLAETKAGISAAECLFCTEDLLHTLAAQQIGFKTARVLMPPQTDIAALSSNLIEAGFI